MWSLIILAFLWMLQSSDAATSVTVAGFSSKLACTQAGEQYIKDMSERKLHLQRQTALATHGQCIATTNA